MIAPVIRYFLVAFIAGLAPPAPEAQAGWSDYIPNPSGYMPDCSSVDRYLGTSAGEYCRTGVAAVEQHARTLRKELVETYESTRESVSIRATEVSEAGANAAGGLRREAAEKLRAAAAFAEERSRCEGLPCGVLTGIPDAARTELHRSLMSLAQVASNPGCEALAREMGMAYKSRPSWPAIDLSGYGQRHPVGCQSDYQSMVGQVFESTIVMPAGCGWSGMKGFAVDGAWGDVEFLGSAVSFIGDSAVFLASLTDDILAQPFVDMAYEAGLADDSTIQSHGYQTTHQRCCELQAKANSGLKATYEIFKRFYDQCGKDPACMDRKLQGFRFSVCRQVDPFFLVAADAQASSQMLKMVLEGLPALDASAAAAISGMKCSEIVDKACRVAGMIGWEVGGDAVASSVAAVLGVGVGGATTLGVTLSKSVLKFATRHVDEFTAFLTKGLPQLIEQIAAMAKIPSDEIIKVLLAQLEAGEEGKKWAKPIRESLVAAGFRVPEPPGSGPVIVARTDEAAGSVVQVSGDGIDDLFLNPPDEVAFNPISSTYYGPPDSLAPAEGRAVRSPGIAEDRAKPAQGPHRHPIGHSGLRTGGTRA
jgi:hypothetical protein